MKKLLNINLLLGALCWAGTIVPILTSCSQSKATLIEASVSKEFFVGSSITRDDFNVTVTLYDGTKQTVTDWQCETSLPYTFVDTNPHEFVIKYNNLTTKVYKRAFEPAKEITIEFVAGEHGSLEGAESVTLQGPIEWSFLLSSLPTPKPDTDYVFDKWIDEDGNELKDDTVISSDLKVTCTFKAVTESERGMTFLKRTVLEDTYYEVKWDGTDNILKDLVIPSSHICPDDGIAYPVKVVSSFKNCAKIETVTIPSSVTTINTEAFAYDSSESNSNLKTVTFASDSNLTKICNGAFSGCGLLSSITIPKTVKTINANAFDMSSTTEPALTTLIFENGSVLETIEKDSFKGCSKLTTVTLPNTIKKLGGFNATSLKSIIVPASVTEILDECFYTSNTLETVDLSACTSLTTIGSSAFRNAKISSIAIPDSVTTICGHAFEDCVSLATVTINETSKLENLGASGGGYVFNDCPIQTFVFPASLQSIGASIFGSESTAKLTSLTFKELKAWTIGSGEQAQTYTPTGVAAADATYFKTNNDTKIWEKQS